jgi:outer membrane protein OmpA-like peptidoglycan-associated protein
MRVSVRILFLIFLTASLIDFSGCATRHYVKHQVAPIESQVADVRNVEAQLTERIDAADRRAKGAIDLANDALMGAAMANEKAVAADRRAAEADRRADGAQVSAMRAMDHIDTVDRDLENRIASLDKYKLAEQKIVTFKFDSDVLSQEAISRLDDLAGLVTGASSGYAVEIQGFTDSTGSEAYNFRLSERRAAAVLRFLASRGVPLYRIAIVGFGKTNPAADNQTMSGREQNRRVEIRVLATHTVATANHSK